MMKRIFSYFLMVLFAGAFVACGDDDEMDGPLTQVQAESFALSAITGTSGSITSSDVDTTSTNLLYYDIDIVTTEGAVLEFEYYQADRSLKSIEGDSGPFDYEVNPGMGLVPFSIARAAALGTISDGSGEILRWDLEFDNSRNIWVYTLEIMDGNEVESTILINASTGTITQ